MELMVAGSRATRRAPDNYFTGTVWQDPIITAPEPARLAASKVANLPDCDAHASTTSSQGIGLPSEYTALALIS